MDFITAAKVSTKSRLSSCLKPWATYLALYFNIWPLPAFFNLKHHRPVMTCQFSGVGASSQVSFSIKESYSICIASFHLCQSERCIACLSVFGSSSPLFSTFDSNILKVCTMCTCDWATQVLVNRARLEGISVVARLGFDWLGFSSSLLNMGAEP